MAKRPRRGVPFRAHLAARRLPRYRDQALYLAAWIVAATGDTIPAAPTDLRSLMGATERPSDIADAIEQWRAAGLVVDAEGGRLRLVEDPLAETLSQLDVRGRRGGRRGGGPTQSPPKGEAEPTQSQPKGEAEPTQRQGKADPTTGQSLPNGAAPVHRESDNLPSGVASSRAREERNGTERNGTEEIPPSPQQGAGTVVPLTVGGRGRGRQLRALVPEEPPGFRVPSAHLEPLFALARAMVGEVQQTHEAQPAAYVVAWAQRLEGPAADGGLGFRLDWAAFAAQVDGHRRVHAVDSVRSLTHYLGAFLDAPSKAERFREGAQQQRRPRGGHDPNANYTRTADDDAPAPKWDELPVDTDWLDGVGVAGGGA